MSKHDFIPQDFLQHLQVAVPGFAVERDGHQMAIARMLWSGFTKTREHSHFAGHLSFTFQELDKGFGRRKFELINSRLGLFSVTQWSTHSGYTKGYAPTKVSTKALDTYLGGSFSTPASLIYEDASGIKALKSPLPAVAMPGSPTGFTKMG